jgi:hypothetical protein
MADALAELSEFKWGGLAIPITRMRMSLGHDLVQHKYVGVDGASVEDTGVDAIVIHATIPLRNGVTRGPRETWEQNPYPSLFRKLVSIFAKRETNDLQHPEWGRMRCKAQQLEIDWDASKRGGVDAEATWIQTNEDGVALTQDINGRQDAAAAAADLDAAYRDLKAIVPKAPEYKESFADAMNKIAGGIDSIGRTTNLAAGRIDQVVYRVNKIQEAAERTKSALTWPITHNSERLKSASIDLKKKLAALGKDIALYRVPVDTTLAGVAAQLPDAQMVDLIRLNPSLMREPAVPAGSMVRYYVSRIAA